MKFYSDIILFVYYFTECGKVLQVIEYFQEV